MRIRLVLILTAAALLPTGCIVEAPTSAGTQAQAGAQRAGAAPPMQVKIGANLQDQLELVGALVDPGQITPGLPAKVTMFFRVLEKIEEDWMVFVHVEDPEGRMERLNVDHKPAGGQYPTNQWKKGETVKDEFQVYLPPGTQARAINVLAGMWNPASDARMKLKNPDQVRNDGRDRMLIAQIPVAQ